MASLILALVGIPGLIITAFAVAIYSRRTDATDHYKALILSIGYTVSWLVAILGAFLGSGTGLTTGRIAFAVLASLLIGLPLYPAVRLWFWVLNSRKR
jgi:hypothetical protein